MILYLTEPGFRLGVSGGHFYIIDSEQNQVKEIPIRLVNNIVIYTSCVITGAASMTCLQNKIPVFFISAYGQVFSKLISIVDMDVELLRQQVLLTTDESTCLLQTKKIIGGKINNQIVYARRLYRGDNIGEIKNRILHMETMYKKINHASSIPEIMGYEGATSRTYFQILTEYLPADYQIKKRTKNPPKDPINSIFSFAYALLHAEIFTALELAGLNPYFSFMHTVQKGHAALASDLIEEFRAAIADSLVVHFVNYAGLTSDDFDHLSSPPGVYLRRKTAKKFISYYEKKIQQKHQYLGKPLSFRESLYTQASHLATCIRSNSLSNYQAFRVR